LSKTPLLRALGRPNTRHLRLDCLEDTTLPWPGPSLPHGLEAKTKKAFQGITLEGLVLNECRPLRALCPPCRYRPRRHGD
jgi:hypothetical protein